MEEIKKFKANIGQTSNASYEAKFSSPPDLVNLRDKIENLNIGNSEIQEFGDANTILLRLEKSLMY